MQFDLLDSYLLTGTPEKRKVVNGVEKACAGIPAAKPFLEGIRILGARTPDLSLIALRLVLAGKPANDQTVLELKQAVDEARAAGPGRETAAGRYHELLASPPSGRNGG